MRVLFEEQIQVDDFSILLQYKDLQNISLRIVKQGKVLVSLPVGSKARAIEFIKTKEDWLRKHLAAKAEQELPVPDNGFDGINIWLWGKHYLADFRKSSSYEEVLLQGIQLVFFYKGTLTERKKQLLVEKFYWECMSEMLTNILSKWQPKVGLYASSWKLQRLKSKWGRCNVRTGELLFNVSLVHRPVSCLEYIVLHELAHLYEPSHSARFHNFVGSFMPNWKERRELLNKFVLKD